MKNNLMKSKNLVRRDKVEILDLRDKKRKTFEKNSEYLIEDDLSDLFEHYHE